MGSAGFGWSGLRGLLVGDVAVADACTVGPKPKQAAMVLINYNYKRIIVNPNEMPVLMRI